MNAKVSPRKTPRRDLIARFAVGVEAVDDNLGCVCIADTGQGFEVFIDGGLLPDGSDFRDFPASRQSCFREAYAFALEVVQELVAEQVAP